MQPFVYNLLFFHVTTIFVYYSGKHVDLVFLLKIHQLSIKYHLNYYIILFMKFNSLAIMHAASHISESHVKEKS